MKYPLKAEEHPGYSPKRFLEVTIPVEEFNALSAAWHELQSIKAQREVKELPDSEEWFEGLRKRYID